MNDEELKQAWRALSVAERREITRAATRGETLDDRRKAALVAAHARRRLRQWWNPLIGAAILIAAWIPLSQALGLDTVAGIIGGAGGAVGITLLQRPRYKAAVTRSEELIARTKRGPGRRGR
ncbi:MAG: hypothetical protein M3198_12920 [Actinomycetota bacterium]|nr:hypothetical protein [Actinomycetota bacterium]